MYNVGLFVGKFIPPHRGHLNAIINLATQCKKLYVVVSDHPELTKKLCKENNLKMMDIQLRTKWLSIELQGFDHIDVIMLNEEGIPMYPDGYKQWVELLKKAVPEKFDVIFGGEVEYKQPHQTYMPEVDYVLYDPKREKYPISATKIRSNPLKYWDYILGSARGHFVKRVLITGSESCGKTTITKYLAKIFHTSWAEEEGRYYSARFLGGNEDVFCIEDFDKIAIQQFQAENHAIKTSNKIVFFDTDALVTQFYAEMYLGVQSNMVESFINPDRYDIVLIFTPDVQWIDDGLRWNSDDEVRKKLHNKLYDMYISRGFEDKIIEISGNYNQRLIQAVSIVEKMLECG